MKCGICNKPIKPNEDFKPFKYFHGKYHTECIENKLKKDYPGLYELLNK